MLRVVDEDGSPEAVLRLRDAVAAAIDGTGPPVLPVGAAAAERAAVLGAVRPDRDDPLDAGAALVVATSGSTGAAKGVVLSGAALRASATATHARLGGAGRWLLAVPARHVAGAQVLVRSVLSGVDPVVLDLRAGFRVEAFAQAVASMPGGAPRYCSVVPTQLVRLLAEPDGVRALGGLDGVLVGGAPLAGTVLARARVAGVRVVTTYGMSETAGGCVYDGLPLDGVRVRIGAGGTGGGAAGGGAGPAGRVELAGPVLAAGYRGLPELTAASFAAGWLRTGDLGRVRDDGSLEVLARLDDVLISGGVNVSPQAVERVLAGVAGVREVCVVGVPDPEWGQRVCAVVVADDPAGPPDAGALRAAVAAELGRAAAPRTVRLVDDLPLRGPGKIDRHAVRALLTPTDP